MKCPRCPYYEQKTSYGTEVIKCNNDECNNEIERYQLMLDDLESEESGGNPK